MIIFCSSKFSLSSNNYALHMHEGQQNQRADRGYSHCHEGARGHHVCARHACAPRPRTKGLCVRWCGAHGTVAHAQRGLGLCMRGLVWPSWSATNKPVNFPSGVVDQHHGLLVCGCCLHACGSSTISRNDQSQQRVALLPCLLRIQLAPQKCDVSA